MNIFTNRFACFLGLLGGVGGGGVSEIQYLVYQQDNVNPFEIYNNWIQLNIVFHVNIIFCRKYVNLISASDFSDFMHN